MRTETKNKATFPFPAMYGCMVLLVLIRIFAWINTVIISRDSTRYVALAKLWMAWKPFKALAHNYHPLYPFLIAMAAKGTGCSLEHAALGNVGMKPPAAIRVLCLRQAGRRPVQADERQHWLAEI